MNRYLIFLIIVLTLTACTTNEEPTPRPLPTLPPAVQATIPPTPSDNAPATAVQPTIEVQLPDSTAEPSSTSESTEVALTEQEVILIQEPGPGWRLTSPLHVSGMADPTFEQNLVFRLLLDDGTELAMVPATIAADIGQRGPFEVDIPFSVSGERQAFLQVFATSARDGGITHLSSVGLRIADSGPENRPSFTPLNERIVISQPTLNTVISGGMIHVEGIALASFEATLVVEVLDEVGSVIGSQPILVQQPDMGLPGTFTADIPYSGSPVGAGRVVIRDPSPAFDGDVHIASVEIRFE